MKKTAPSLAGILKQLEKHYGKQVTVGPRAPYERILFVNCGYPATDASSTKGYEALKREVGTKPEEILAAPKEKLAELMRLGGIVPELRAERLKTVARMVNELFGGDFERALGKMMRDEKMPADKRIRRVKTALKEFPVIGDPGADRILLFARLARVAAVPSASVAVPQRILFGAEDKNYSAGYRAAQEAMSAELPETFGARERAYLLLKRHGAEICKRTKPKCERCPISGRCAYFREKRPEKQ
jgi:endonuclease III